MLLLIRQRKLGFVFLCQLLLALTLITRTIPRLATQARTIPVESVTSPELKSNSSYYTGKNEALQTEKTCDIAKCATII
ncbi:hypothetical protein M645_11445 [Listeria monocytogenes]|nr:hypothetical protein M645_11445 [Listeria monocytogenes]